MTTASATVPHIVFHNFQGIILQHKCSISLQQGSYGQSIHEDLSAQNLSASPDRYARDTPLKFNMEPEKKSLEKEIPFGNHHFQVPC